MARSLFPKTLYPWKFYFYLILLSRVKWFPSYFHLWFKCWHKAEIKYSNLVMHQLLFSSLFPLLKNCDNWKQKSTYAFNNLFWLKTLIIHCKRKMIIRRKLLSNIDKGQELSYVSQQCFTMLFSKYVQFHLTVRNSTKHSCIK